MSDGKHVAGCVRRYDKRYNCTCPHDKHAEGCAFKRLTNSHGDPLECDCKPAKPVEGEREQFLDLRYEVEGISHRAQLLDDDFAWVAYKDGRASMKAENREDVLANLLNLADQYFCQGLSNRARLVRKIVKDYRAEFEVWDALEREE